MVDLIAYLPYFTAIIAAAFPAPYLHEGSHWIVGRLGNTNPRVHWTLGIFPNGVSHGTIDTMDATVIRLCGAAPFTWIPVWTLAAALFIIFWTPGALFAMMVPFYTVFFYSTESDAIALLEPERYREMEMNDELERNPLFFPNWIIPNRIPRF